MALRTLLAESEQTAKQRSPWPIFLLCWLCLLADGYDLLAYGATLPGLIGRPPFNLTIAEGGLIGSIALVGMLVGSLVAGMVTDVLGRRRTFIISVAVFSVAIVLTALAPNAQLFLILRVVTCVGVGGLLPTAVALASEFAAPEKRSRTLGVVLTGGPCGMVVAALLSSNVVPTYGFRPVYAAGGLAIPLVLVLLKYLPESPAFLVAQGDTERAAAVCRTYGLPLLSAARPTVTKAPLAALLGNGNLLPTLMIWGIKVFGLLTVYGISTWLPQVMARSGYGLGSAIAFLVIYSLGAVVGTLLAASLAERVGPKPLVVVGYVAAAAALLLIAQRPAAPVLVVLVLVAGFGGFGTQNVLNDFISRFYPTANRASGLGWALGIGALGSILGPSVGATVIATASPLQATGTVFAITAGMGAVIMVLTPTRAPTLAVEEAAAAEPLAVRDADRMARALL